MLLYVTARKTNLRQGGEEVVRIELPPQTPVIYFVAALGQHKKTQTNLCNTTTQDVKCNNFRTAASNLCELRMLTRRGWLMKLRILSAYLAHTILR
eukprot:3890728-Amphidinium_carterae.1